MMIGKKIMIIGSPGSGKTTLSKELGKILNIEVTHLDVLNWTGNWEVVPRDEFEEKLRKSLKKDKVIIDGNYNRTIPLRLNYCDTVIYLDYPKYISFLRVIKRVIFNYGKSRKDMGGNCPERFDFEFLKFVWDYNKNNRSQNYELLEKCKDKNIYIFKKPEETKEFLNTLPTKNPVI